ncbi:hypothetical protein J1N35_023081 [Gossypium stocksii]|uniref:RING-type domain-containing protein n=1 Tax=Gossypium stocksii TaxID=47602 RepID=A0A9D4A3J8_9ROSI|nr:hypothetical protein J1N35_023081 [Gossypium stocksii]
MEDVVSASKENRFPLAISASAVIASLETTISAASSTAVVPTISYSKYTAVSHGKPELYVVLCLASKNETQSNRMPPDVEDIVNSYHLTPFITEEYAATGTLNQNYANILLMLLRLCQACDHPLLVKGFNNDSIWNSDSVENSNPVGQVSVEMAKTLPRELLINLLNSLETSFAICLVCQDTPDEPVVTMCGHVFYYQCVSDHLTGDDNTCPTPECREQLGDDIVFSKATLRGCLAGDLNSSSSHPQFFGKSVILQDDYSSSKIQAVLEILQSKCLLKNSSPESPSSIGSSEAPFSSEQTFKKTGHSGSKAVKHTTVYSNLPAD